MSCNEMVKGDITSEMEMQIHVASQICANPYEPVVVDM